MCSAKKPKVVAPPVVEEEVEADEKAVKARNNEKKKAQAMLGRRSTILTGNAGLQDQAPIAKKTLLGS